MINEEYINEQIEISKKEKYTSSFIRNFVFKVVDIALRSEYGDNYSSLCLQSSAAVNLLLSRFGIQSRLILGSVCVIEVYKHGNQYHWQWGGFWDNDHHIFVISEYSDLIDLTISQLNLHPLSERKDFLPLLPVWWTPVSKWPMMIKYLPEKIAEISLTQNKMDELDRFLNRTSQIADDLFQNSNIDEITFSPILTGLDSLNTLTESGNKWLKFTKKVVMQGISYPDGIIKKEEQLINSIKKNS